MAKKQTTTGDPKERGSWRRKYANADALQEKCDEYFAKCDAEGKLYGEAGLALHLGVKIGTMRGWYDGTDCADLQEPVQRAYLRIQAQLESDPTYMQKGMVTKAIFLMKQPRFGGYQDKIEAKQDISVNVKMGNGMDDSDFK
ncbi:MAG: DNA-packaging protein [Clostridiales bacterium]|nr:DNA-packaging protein [Clostridiales bacterium]